MTAAQEEITPIEVTPVMAEREILLRIVNKVNELIEVVRDLKVEIRETADMTVALKREAKLAGRTRAVARTKAVDPNEITDKHDLRKLLSEARFIRRRAIGVTVGAITLAVLALLVWGFLTWSRSGGHP